MPRTAKATEDSKGYKGHQAGSRKGRVHETFDKKGQDAARSLGQKLKLSNGTLNAWLGAWRRDGGKGKAKPKAKATKVVKAKARKAKAAPTRTMTSVAA